MIPFVRHKFNASFTKARYAALRDALETKYQVKIPFRVAESPVFLSAEIKNQLIEAGAGIIDFLVRKDFLSLTERAIPAGRKVSHETAHPLFISIDFALADDGAGGVIPQLIELQGFPSLYCYQEQLAIQYCKTYEIPVDYTWLFNGLSADTYHEKLKKAILGDHEPSEVILLDLQPKTQATYIDFLATEEKLGIKAVGLEEIYMRQNKLYYKRSGLETHVKRIYNRVIADELEHRTDLDLRWNMTEEAEVEWAGHPNWFYRISKFIMPMLHGPFIPESHFLNEYKELPDDLENYVLKPLYSFAGSGVIYHVKKHDLEAINDKENYILQRKVTYLPLIESPDGKIKTEIRLMYLWEENQPQPMLLTNLCRLSRGDMIGVKFNQDKTWVGGTIAFFE